MIRTGNITGARGPSKIAIWGCVALSIAGALTTISCLLAMYLESSGLGAAPRDGAMRPGYTMLLITGAGAGILVPTAACFAVLPTSYRFTVVMAASAAVVVAIATLGIMGS